MHALLNNTLQLTVGPEARNELQRIQNVSLVRCNTRLQYLLLANFSGSKFFQSMA